jgi:hypothetical protein
MPNIAEQLASYSCNLYYRDLPSGTTLLAKRMMIDTVACALGGYPSRPSQIARDMAATVTTTQTCTVMGSGQTASANGRGGQSAGNVHTRRSQSVASWQCPVDTACRIPTARSHLHDSRRSGSGRCLAGTTAPVARLRLQFCFPPSSEER